MNFGINLSPRNKKTWPGSLRNYHKKKRRLTFSSPTRNPAHSTHEEQKWSSNCGSKTTLTAVVVSTVFFLGRHFWLEKKNTRKKSAVCGTYGRARRKNINQIYINGGQAKIYIQTACMFHQEELSTCADYSLLVLRVVFDLSLSFPRSNTIHAC